MSGRPGRPDHPCPLAVQAARPRSGAVTSPRQGQTPHSGTCTHVPHSTDPMCHFTLGQVSLVQATTGLPDLSLSGTLSPCAPGAM